MAVLAVMGYGEQLDHVVAILVPILVTLAGGGVVVKAIEGGVEKKKALLEEGHLEAIIEDLQKQLEAKKA